MEKKVERLALPRKMPEEIIAELRLAIPKIRAAEQKIEEAKRISPETWSLVIDI